MLIYDQPIDRDKPEVRPAAVAAAGGFSVSELVQLLWQRKVAIVSAALGFWAAEAPTMLGFLFWWARGDDYTPTFSRVNGVLVDYAAAARAAASLEEDVDVEAGAVAATPLSERQWDANA